MTLALLFFGIILIIIKSLVSSDGSTPPNPLNVQHLRVIWVGYTNGIATMMGELFVARVPNRCGDYCFGNDSRHQYN